MPREPSDGYVLLLTYRDAGTRIDREMKAHRRFLDRFDATEEFLAFGPPRPRGGGVILARCVSRARVEQITTEDPFVQQSLADYEVIALAPNRSPVARQLREVEAPA